MQTVMKRKLGLFGHTFICRMKDSRKIIGRRGRPIREWIDDIKEWCKKDLYSLATSARD